MAGDESYRLPRQARPHRYDLELTPQLGAARFEGRVTISVEVLEPSDRLVLHAADLEIAHAAVTTPDGRVLEPVITLDEPDQMLVLTFPAPLGTGDHRLRIDFAGTLNDQLRGFYRSTFVDDDGVEQVVAITQFEATDARRAFPCWDEPDFKAVFAVTLVVEDGLTAISNGPLTSSTRRADGRVEMRFADTMVMSTYLVAFVVGPYEISEPDYVDGVPVRIAAPRGRLGLSAFAASAARHALHFLSGYFGIPYPGGKLDHIAVPDFAFGAMENLGCVTYRDRLLLVDPDNAAQTELQNVAIVVAHETAHMWFGDLVTMKWWNGIWLNEAFATFMELTTSDDFRPDWQVWTAFGAGKAAALAVDGLRATRPVEYPVGRPEEAEGMFDVLTYQKGGSVLRMLEQFLGPEVFRQGISHYLATHAYANTDTEDLWAALEHVSGQPVRHIMATWIQQGGYPMIHARLDEDGRSVQLRQERFLYSPGSSAGESGARWVVPVNLRASVGGELVHGRLLLEDGGTSFTFPGPVDWLVVNDGAWGYYRVRYGEDLLARLRAADPVAVMAPLERLQLVGDTWAAVMAGQGSLEEWVAAATAVAADPDPDVWMSLSAGLRSLTLVAHEADGATASSGPVPDGATAASGSPSSGSAIGDARAVQALTRRLAGPPGAVVGWDPAAGEGDRRSIARGRILAVLADCGADEDVIAEARRRYDAHLADRAGGALAPDLIRTAAAIAVAHGDADIWQRTLDAFHSTDRAVEQLRYLSALAETPVPELRLRLLEMTVGGEVRSQDGPFIIAAALGHPGAAPQVWEWIEANWSRIAERFPPSLAIRMFDALSAVCDAGLAARVRSFCEKLDLAISAVRMEQILERMDLSVALAARLRGRLADSLA